MGELGRLERVDLRQVWASEPGDFTPWLADEANIRLLGQAIEIDLEVQSTEKGIGPFRADIFCKDVGNDAWVLIENQLEKTNHVHLGQLLTYASGLDAVTIVWVAQTFTEEHRAALDWLNEKTEEGINFFGLEIELWRIGDSPMAPKFIVVSKPNDWSRRIRADASSMANSETGQQQLAFWTRFAEHMADSPYADKIKPRAKSDLQWSFGRPGVQLGVFAGRWDQDIDAYAGVLRVALRIQGKDRNAIYEALQHEKAALEKEIGAPLLWDGGTDKTVWRIYVRHPADVEDESKWPEQFAWLGQMVRRFDEVFEPRVKRAGAGKRDGVV